VRSPNFTVISNAGDSTARSVADHFEQFRQLFQNAFPKMRVDLGKPLIIFALKNEDSMKLFLPGYWETKGHTHPFGLYAPGEDKHFVLVRTDAAGDNPYEVVYHEYTHALMDLNFRGLPLWFGEGLAEFFANSTIRDKEVEIGHYSPYHLRILQENKLIPIDTLLQVDHTSPYYNEQNRTTVFYAESWTLVHYLMLDPDARKRHLLQSFLDAFDASGNQIEAAQKAFGDLKKFAATMDSYSRQTSFYVSPVKLTVHADPKSYASRALPQSEADAIRGEFYVHTQRPKEAKTALDAARQAAPNLPAVYEGLGELAYSQQDLETAEKEFARAVALNSGNFLAYFFNARSHMRHNMATSEDSSLVIADLEKSISINPNFAPSYSVLATLYSLRPETREKAYAAGRKAILLEPGNLSYAINYGYVLLNTGKVAEAKVLAQRIQSAAKTPGEQNAEMQFSQAINSRELYEQQAAAYNESAKQGQAAGAGGKTIIIGQSPVKDPTAPNPTNNAGVAPIGSNPTRTGARQYSLEGKVTGADCASSSNGKVTLSISSVLMKFHYVDLSKVQLSSTAKSATAPACSAWKGQKAKVTFEPAQSDDYDGELTAIQFF